MKRYQYFCITKRNFHSEVSKILADLLPFKRRTGLLQVQPCFEIHVIDYFIIGMLIVFVTVRDIHDFLTLSSWLQIHENAIEIAFNLKEDFMQRRKVPDKNFVSNWKD